MSLDERDWYREAIEERDRKNAEASLMNKQNKNYAGYTDPNARYSWKIVIAGALIFAVLVYVLDFILYYPASGALIGMNILVFALIKLKKLNGIALASSHYSVIDGKQEYRIVTSAFTHFEPIHLLCNLSSLYNIGPYMETYLGTERFIICYALIMVLGGYISAYLHKNKPMTYSIGASGVICGLLGIFLTISYINSGFAGISSMVPTICILAAMTLSPKIDSIGHFTGMAVGIVCGLALIYLL